MSTAHAQCDIIAEVADNSAGWAALRRWIKAGRRGYGVKVVRVGPAGGRPQDAAGDGEAAHGSVAAKIVAPTDSSATGGPLP
jgi:hypothetical protein